MHVNMKTKTFQYENFPIIFATTGPKNPPKRPLHRPSIIDLLLLFLQRIFRLSRGLSRSPHSLTYRKLIGIYNKTRNCPKTLE